MPHAYCTGCDARVTVRDGQCLLGHPVEAETVSSRPGRRISPDSRPVLDARSAGRQAGKAATALLTSLRSPARTSSTSPGSERPQARPTITRPDLPRPSLGRPRSSRPVLPRTETRPMKPSGGLAEVNPTSELVLTLWAETDAPAAAVLTDDTPWETPEPLSDLPQQRPTQWVTALLVVIGLIAAFVAIGELFDNREARAEALVEQTATVAQHLAAIPAENPAEAVADLDSAARDLFDMADRLPVGDTHRALAIDAAGRALDGAEVVARATSYAASLDVVTRRPGLPLTAEVGQLPDLTAELSGWTTDVVGVLGSVPTDPSFAGHAELAAKLEVRFPKLQAAYLDGIRAGDSAATSQALEAIDAALGELQQDSMAAVTASIESVRALAPAVADLQARMAAE